MIAGSWTCSAGLHEARQAAVGCDTPVVLKVLNAYVHLCIAGKHTLAQT